MDDGIYQEMELLREENKILKMELKKVSDENKEREFDKKRLDALLAYIPTVVWSTDREGIFTSIEGLGLEILGLKPGQLVGLSVFDVYAEFTNIINAHKNTLEGIDSSYLVELNGIQHIVDGIRLHGVMFDAKTIPIINDQGDIDGLIGTAFNITSLKNVEKKLAESETQYLGLYDNLPISVWEEDLSAVKKYVDNLIIPTNITIETFLDNNPEVVRECIRLVKIINVNQYTLELYQAENKEMLLENLEQVVTLDSLNDVKKEVIAVYNKSSNFTMEIIQQKLNGDKMDVILNWFVPEQYRKTFERVYLTIQDISQIKNLEGNLREKTKYRESLSEIGKIAISSTNLYNLFNYCVESASTNMNIEFCKILELQENKEAFLLIAGFGWKDGMVGRTIVDANDKSQAGYTLLSSTPIIVQNLEKETRFSSPKILLDHNINSGISVIIGNTKSPWGIFAVHSKEEKIYSDNDVYYIQSIANLLSISIEREKVREKMIKSQAQALEQYQSFFVNNVSLVFWIEMRNPVTIKQSVEEQVDEIFKEAYFKDLSQMGAEMYGYKSRDMIVGKPITDIWPKELTKRGGLVYKNYENLIREGYVVRKSVIRSMNKQGEEKCYIISAQCIIEDNCIVRVWGSQIDITKQKLAEEEIIKSNMRYRYLFESSNAGISISTIDGKIIEVNEAFAKIMGYQLEEISMLNAKNIYYDQADREILIETLEQKGQVSNYETKFVTKDNVIKWISATTRLMKFGDEERILAIINEIDKKKRMENHLESYRKCLSAVLYAKNELLLMKEICDILVNTTKYYMAWIGYAEDDEVKSVVPIVFSGSEKNYLKNVTIRWDDSEFGMGPTGMAIKTKQTQMASKFGTNPKFKPWKDPAMKRGYQASVAIPMIIEESQIATLNVYSPQENPFNDEELVLLEGIAENLTFGIRSLKTKLELNQVLTDLDKKVHDRTLELQIKNEELSDFTFSVTHDLRAPLRAMQGFSKAIAEDYQDVLNEQGLEMANRINKAAEKMDSMIKDLLIHSKIIERDIRIKDLDLEDYINEAVNENIDIINENGIEISIDIISQSIRGSRVIVKQVINNLISNAIKFIDKNKSPRITIWSETRENMIRLFIEDNGIGIEEEYFEKIFKVFERLHSEEQYPGTGIGLAIVKKGIERMQGRYGVESNFGEFSRFWIELPIRE